VISEIHDEQTRDLLLRAGFASGCRFVEFGCGLGYVTRWAAAMGADAVGIDANEEQVEASQELAKIARLTNARFRTASIYEPGIEAGTLDITYCRWLMVHLNRPVEAMHVIYKALKPGGVMVCEEADVSAVYAEPRSPAYEEIREIALKAGQDRGVDYTGGRRAHLWAKEAGFQLVHVAAYHPHHIDGPHKGFWNWTLRNVVQRLVEEGSLPTARLRDLVMGMTEADESLDTVVAHCRMHHLVMGMTEADESLDTVVAHCRMHQLIAKKPAN
jgi:SAM-dependent methyltransferase